MSEVQVLNQRLLRWGFAVRRPFLAHPESLPLGLTVPPTDLQCHCGLVCWCSHHLFCFWKHNSDFFFLFLPTQNNSGSFLKILTFCWFTSLVPAGEKTDARSVLDMAYLGKARAQMFQVVKFWSLKRKKKNNNNKSPCNNFDRLPFPSCFLQAKLFFPLLLLIFTLLP